MIERIVTELCLVSCLCLFGSRKLTVYHIGGRSRLRVGWEPTCLRVDSCQIVGFIIVGTGLYGATTVTVVGPTLDEPDPVMNKIAPTPSRTE